ncbi:MAG: retention module-containing protein, partial [Azoarcus sp.]|nr:retention module-containing protein [Azoarcus sp.]
MSNQIVAAVDSVNGQAFARDPDGALRTLEAGVPLYDGEILVADPGSEVVVAPGDGSPPYHVGGPMQLAMATDIPADDAEIDPETLAELIDKFKHGEDFPAPAAGGGGGSRPHNLVVLERLLEPVEPASVSPETVTQTNEGPYNPIPLSLGGVGTPVTPVPEFEKPVGTDDNYSVVEGSMQLLSSVLANDGAGSGATVGQVLWNGVWHDVPDGGFKFTTGLNGVVWMYPDGTFEYGAPVRYNSGIGTDTDGPDVDHFQYRFKDASGNLSDPVTVNIDITDTVPVAHDDEYTLSEQNAAFRIEANVMDNDEPSQDWITKGKDGVQNVVWQVRTGDGATEISVDGSYDPNVPTL